MSNGDAKPAWETDPDVTPVPPDRATPQSWRKQADVEGVPGHWQDGQWETYGSTDPDDPNFGVGPPPPTSVGEKLGMAGQSFVRGVQQAQPIQAHAQSLLSPEAHRRRAEGYGADTPHAQFMREHGLLTEEEYGHEIARRKRLTKEQEAANYLSGSRWLSSIPEAAGELVGDPTSLFQGPATSSTAARAAGSAARRYLPRAVTESAAGRFASRAYGPWAQRWSEAQAEDRTAASWGRTTPGMRPDVPARALWQIVETALGSMPGGSPIVHAVEGMQSQRADVLGEIIHEMAGEGMEEAPVYIPAEDRWETPRQHGRERTGGRDIYQHFRSLGYPPDAAAAMGLGQWQERLRPDERRLLETIFTRPGGVTNIQNAHHAQDMNRLFEHIANSGEHAALSFQVFNSLTRDMGLEQRQLLAALMLHRMGTVSRAAERGTLRFGGQWTLENFLRNWEGMDHGVRNLVFGPEAIGTYYVNDINRSVEAIQRMRRYAPMAARSGRDASRRPFPMRHAVGSWTEGAAVVGGLIGWLAGRPGSLEVAGAAAGVAGTTAAGAWALANPAKARWLARQLTRYVALEEAHRHRQGELSAQIDDPDFLDELNIAQGPEPPLTDPLDKGPWRIAKPVPQ